MQKILITGSSGLLGSYLFPKIKSDKFKIVRFKRSKTADLSNLNYCESYLKKSKFDIIINLSAITNVDMCEKNKKLANKVNFVLIKNICKATKKLSLKTHIVHLSTDQFYNNFSSNFEKKISYVNYYTKSKLMAEEVCLKVNSTILRTNFIGKSKNKKRISFSDWIYFNLKMKKNITLADDIKFSPLSLRSLSNIIKLVIKKKFNGVYNVGSHKGYSKYNFAIKFAKKMKLNSKNIIKVKYKDINFFAVRNKDMRMKVIKFEKKFDYKFKSLDFELEEIISEYKRN